VGSKRRTHPTAGSCQGDRQRRCAATGQALAQYRNVRVGLQSLSRRHTPSCLPPDTGPTRRWYEPDKSRLCRGPAMKPMTSRIKPRMSTLWPPPAHLYASCAEGPGRPDSDRSPAEVSIGTLALRRTASANRGELEAPSIQSPAIQSPARTARTTRSRTSPAVFEGKVGQPDGLIAQINRATFPVPASSAESAEERLDRQNPVVERVAIIRNAKTKGST
jgi:hypothetical protein